MLLSPAGGQMHIHSFDLVSIKSHLQLILPLHLNTVIANGFRKLCKKGRQQLKLHFGGESLTCARAFSSAVATPCSDSEAAQHPLQREESTETKPFKSKSGRTPIRNWPTWDTQEHIPRGAEGAATASARARQSESRSSTATRRRTPPPPLPCLLCCRCCAITLPAWSGAGHLPLLFGCLLDLLCLLNLEVRA